MTFEFDNDRYSIWFDKDTFVRGVLVVDADLADFSRAPTKIDQFPISNAGRAALKRFYQRRNVFEGMNRKQAAAILYGKPYTDFLSRYCDLPEEVVALFVRVTDGYWGVQAHSLSVAEARCG